MVARLALAGFAVLLYGLVLAQECTDQPAPDYDGPVAAAGWEYSLVVGELVKPRGLLFDTNGALLVVDSSVGILHLTLNDGGGTCLTVDQRTLLVSSSDLNHGIALSPDGRTLYASSADKAYSWAYDADAARVVGPNRTLVANMSNSDHTTRTLLLSKKEPGFLLVSRGSDTNEDPDAERLETGHSQIRAFNIAQLDEDSEPYDFSSDGITIGWGLRNSVGVAEEPTTGGIWSVENSVDDLRRNGVDIHQDNPGEELNFHGYLNGSTENQGGNYGYPLCYALWSTDSFPDRGSLETGDQFSTADTTAFNDDTCQADYESPRLVFQAHTAPLDIKFTDDGTRAYITFHGSWNRDDPVGYTLSAVDFAAGEPVHEPNSMTAAKVILRNPTNEACPDACFRPVGLAWDREDRLYMTSDATGEIYVLRRVGEEGDDSSGDESPPSDSDQDSKDEDDAAGRVGVFVTSAPWLTIIAVCLAFVV